MKKLLVAFLILIGGISALAQQQVLDPSFAQNGVLFESYGSAFHVFSTRGQDLVLTGGYDVNQTYYSLLGYKKKGNVNLFFGTNGHIDYASDSFGPDFNIKGYNIRDFFYVPGSHPYIGWEVVKYDTLGRKQLGFGRNGYIGGIGMQNMNAFTIDSQERLIVGSTETTLHGQGTQLIRFLPNGDFDSTFGINGFSIIITENYGAGTKGVYILQDGRILAGETGGGGAGTWMSVRFMPNGGPDYSYGDSGKVILPLPGYFMRGTIVQPDKKVLQWGDNDSLMVIRLKENGSFDSTFGINGKMRYQHAKMRTMLLMDDGRILLGGDTEDSMFAIYRLMPNGRLDTTFGVGSMVRIKLRPSGEHRMNDLAMQADGKLLAGGYTTNGLLHPNRIPYLTVARFMPDGRLDVSFVPPANKFTGILLYPNPTEKTLAIQKIESFAGTVQLQIVDVTGRVVLTKQFEKMNTQPVEISVGDLVPGMYQVVLKETGGKTWTEAFIKK